MHLGARGHIAPARRVASGAHRPDDYMFQGR